MNIRMKILVTGGAGFIGSHIVDLLINEGCEVCIIDNLIHGTVENLNSKASFYKIDIRHKDVIKIFKNEKPDILVHHAAQINIPSSIDKPMYDASVNIIGTLNLLECARKTGVKKVIYPASAAIFGEPVYLPIDEEHSIEMISSYGVSKHTVEHYLKVYKYLYNMDYVILIYSNVYGPRQDSSGEGGVVSNFSKKMTKGVEPFIYGDGEQIRDFVYVKDVAKANLLAIEKSKNGVFNVCTNEKISINDLIKYINRILSKNIKPIYKPRRVGDIRVNYMTYEKIKEELGWKPKYNIIEGLSETLKFYVEKSI